MAKNFEKKIIIGSVFGIIATVIGTIAIFFPSLLDLEKEEMSEPVAITITTNKDLEALYKIISSKNFEEPQIFKLDINFCRMQDIPYSVDNWSDDILIQEDDDLRILISDARPSLENKHWDDLEWLWLVIDLEGRINIKYLPPNATHSCGEDESYVVSGYFMPVEKYSPHGMEEIITLRNVPDEQLMLKNY